MLSFNEIEREFLRRKISYEARCHSVAERLQRLRQREWERFGADVVLRSALPQEVSGLRAILRIDESAGIDQSIEAIRRAGSNTTASIARKVVGRDPYVTYREVLEDVAKKLKVKGVNPDMPESSIERTLTATTFKAAWDKATPAEREALVQHLSASDRKALYSMGATGSVLAGAGAAGFPLYVAASTVLGSLTTAIGVTLPFAAYTTMSSGIALMTGPAGWLALLGLAAWKVGDVDYKTTVPAVIAVAAVRARLIAERDQEIAALEAEQHESLKTTATRLAELEALLGRMRAEGLRTIPREGVPL
jgi:uncharacterized protein YaaW (UPF0174 family)